MMAGFPASEVMGTRRGDVAWRRPLVGVLRSESPPGIHATIHSN
jgi:hypothetical protein